MTKCTFLTFRHDVMHGNGQEEDGVTVVSPGASAKVLLHGLHNREQLLCESHHIMEQHLHVRPTRWIHVSKKKKCRTRRWAGKYIKDNFMRLLVQFCLRFLLLQNMTAWNWIKSNLILRYLVKSIIILGFVSISPLQQVAAFYYNIQKSMGHIS